MNHESRITRLAKGFAEADESRIGISPVGRVADVSGSNWKGSCQIFPGWFFGEWDNAHASDGGGVFVFAERVNIPQFSIFKKTYGS